MKTETATTSVASKRHHHIGLPKRYKLQRPIRRWAEQAAITAMVTPDPKSGSTQKGPASTARQNNINLVAEREYDEWRKTGFKGAWWWRYFKHGDAE